MNNLFIMHTQYNLIIACGLIKEKLCAENNDLIIHAEFNLSDDFKNNLKKVFNNVWCVQEQFVAPKQRFEYEIDLYKKSKLAKDVFKNKYDNVFLSQEQYFDTLVLSKVNRNGSLRCFHIEEDVYFSLDDKRNYYNTSNFMVKEGFKTKLRKIFRKMLYGNNKFYYHQYCYGMSPIYTDAYVSFPSLVRNELQDKTLNEITPEIIVAGIHALYSEIKYEIQDDSSYVLFFFDLISRYKNKKLISDIVTRIVDYCKNENMMFLYKYHPRETEEFESLETNKSCFKIPSLIPSEKILAESIGKSVIVVGNATTAIQIAAKLGFKTISIAKLNDFNNVKAIDTFKRMGIYVPESFEELDLGFANIKLGGE